ncbi:hypothetical protein PSI23_18725 [Xenorhabdus sp. XENO-10]|uniref:GemA protein n=1 Tax=Xenorhabdus yunnanensis TaxID=3025878 RepID=A0ABT5LJG7_9GAMM|nr:hypothetical protein [Xenorhabdus yunnanensis]MDC9591266.1 hypothetical protein [Xenorhabdus yunnanensis]
MQRTCETLGTYNLCLPREEVRKIYDLLYRELVNATEKPAPKRIKGTAKQSKFIVSLLRSHGCNDDDFKGSISSLRKKIVFKANIDIDPDLDDKTLIAWLKKAEVRT